MIIVAHRGNRQGPKSCEHDMAKLADAMDQGFYLELDLWFVENNYYLGHDGPQQRIDLKDFDRPKVFFHLKNLFMPNLKYADAFAIHKDDFVLSLRGRLWCNYNVGHTPNSIVCAPELVGKPESLEAFLLRHQDVLGVCTDYADKARDLLSLTSI